MATVSIVHDSKSFNEKLNIPSSRTIIDKVTTEIAIPIFLNNETKQNRLIDLDKYTPIHTDNSSSIELDKFLCTMPPGSSGGSMPPLPIPLKLVDGGAAGVDNPSPLTFRTWLSRIAEVILQIALRALYIGANIFIAFSLPAAWHWIAVPIVAISSSLVSAFFFTNSGATKSEIFVPLRLQPEKCPDHYPSDSPVGYKNEGQDCGINSMAHFLDSDPKLAPFLRNPLKFLRKKNLSTEEHKLWATVSQFYLANDLAVKNRYSVSTGNSSFFRDAFIPFRKDFDRGINQPQDAHEAADAILDLVPDEYKMRIEWVKYYKDGQIEHDLSELWGIFPLDIKSNSKPTLSELIKANCTDNNQDNASPISERVGSFGVAPPALRFQIKRFETKQESDNKQTFVRVTTPITCPEEIAITLKNGEVHHYHLASFVTHEDTPNGGHYRSGEIRNGNKFLENDSQVILVDSEELKSLWNEYLCQAYLLCYVPKDPHQA